MKKPILLCQLMHQLEPGKMLEQPFDMKPPLCIRNSG